MLLSLFLYLLLFLPDFPSQRPLQSDLKSNLLSNGRYVIFFSISYLPPLQRPHSGRRPHTRACSHCAARHAHLTPSRTATGTGGRELLRVRAAPLRATAMGASSAARKPLPAAAREISHGRAHAPRRPAPPFLQPPTVPSTVPSTRLPTLSPAQGRRRLRSSSPRASLLNSSP